MIKTNQGLNAQNWEVQIDLSIQNSKKSQLAKGSFYFYYIRDNPEKTPVDFARGLNHLLSGLMIEIKENNSRLNPKDQKQLVDGVPTQNLNKQHDIFGYITNENMHPLNQKAKTWIKDEKEDEFKKCFALQIDLKFEGYMFLAASSGKAVNNKHALNSIKTFDLDRVYSDPRDQVREEEFTQSGKNILEKSPDQFKDVEEQYNKQLIRHSNIYSSLVGEFASNNLKIIEFLSNLPKSAQHESIYKNLIDNEAQIDKLANTIRQVIQTHQNSFQSQDGQQNGSQQNINLDIINQDQRYIASKVADHSPTLSNFQNSFNNDQLLEIIGRDKKHLQSRGGSQKVSQSDFEEEDIEIQLEKMIGVMIEGSKDKVLSTLSTDDFVDYIIMMVLIMVAAGGFLMWRKLQEQKGRILL